MTDWRGLCEELLLSWDADGCDWKPQHQARWNAAIERVRTALDLAQPEPEVVGPSDEELLATLDKATADFPPRHPEAVALNSVEYPLALELRKARAVLARWGRHAPVPAEGEVGELVVDELVRQLRTKAATEKANRCHYSVILLTRAADLLERQAAPVPAGDEVAELVAWLRKKATWHQADEPEATLFDSIADQLERQAAPVPVAVSERLPEPSVKVLAHYFNGLGKGRTICAIWVPAKTRSDSYGDDDFTEYDEVSDTFYWPEGWYEAIENWDDLGYVKVDEGEVICWQPLPKWPAHALPLPSGEVEA